ncbi:hypothetical protein [Candidatus Chloroploca asiatica]|uniref:Uncharacterized protein n=1 Tax=Candidatus Chloroploca asiatica TaxID=1506545 RepID=A0A2H3KVB4_9CHLR|nr:hypothetical protein [Candidatus Chloroploca asiatica]PDV99277.1 hypothetical protein A9Q02_13025 [Candidatus Chloroploca asiatica]
MATITLEIPDALAEQIAQMQDRLPELLSLSLKQPALPAATYRAILAFLACNPSPAEVDYACRVCGNRVCGESGDYDDWHRAGWIWFGGSRRRS